MQANDRPFIVSQTIFLGNTIASILRQNELDHFRWNTFSIAGQRVERPWIYKQITPEPPVTYSFVDVPLLSDLSIALGIAIFSKSTAHGHFLENPTSHLFNIACPVKSCLLLFNWGQGRHQSLHSQGCPQSSYKYRFGPQPVKVWPHFLHYDLS